jgi:hypothetical protein
MQFSCRGQKEALQPQQFATMPVLTGRHCPHGSRQTMDDQKRQPHFEWGGATPVGAPDFFN